MEGRVVLTERKEEATDKDRRATERKARAKDSRLSDGKKSGSDG